jgi:hypothetical protein
MYRLVIWCNSSLLNGGSAVHSVCLWLILNVGRGCWSVVRIGISRIGISRIGGTGIANSKPVVRHTPHASSSDQTWFDWDFGFLNGVLE